jgi:three-Cys-motif partner protein
MRRIKKHTVEKLRYYEKYINAFLFATKKLKGYDYKTILVDAFAGTGKCYLCNEPVCKSKGGMKCSNCGKYIKKVDGSTLIALKAEKEFDSYIFIEMSKKNIKILKEAVEGEIGKKRSKKVEYIDKDANKALLKFSQNYPRKAAYLVFLDPAGPELLWTTIQELSKVNKIDILVLYPYEMSLVRLTKDYKEKLDLFYGKEWRNIYKSRSNPSDGNRKLLNFYIDKLEELGFHVLKRPIRRDLRKGQKLYHLIFVSRNPRAMKIMSDIFNNPLYDQLTLCELYKPQYLT